MAPGVTVEFAQLTRHVFASSSCGLCGKESIDAICQNFPAIESNDFRIEIAMLLALPDKLHANQSDFARTSDH